MKALLLILLFGGGAVALLSPLKAQGDALWGPGFGDLLNGGVAMGLLLTRLGPGNSPHRRAQHER